MRGHVISHTHWDREWYLTVEQCRFRLVRCLDRAIDLLERDPAWHSFFLDGQVQPLLDYLEARPERRERVRALVAGRKLRIGPWYTAPDGRIPDGEALVRNLLLGRAEAAAFGRAEPVGYAADQFGHAGQLPQILRGFGIDNAVFWRGYDEGAAPAAECRWSGADGTEVLALLLVQGYTNAAGFGPGPAGSRKLERTLPRLIELSRTGHLAVCEGTDHSLPPADLGAVLAEMRRAFPGIDFRASSWAELLRAVRAARADLPALHGELILAPGLQGTGSARLDQKQDHMACEYLLLRCAEPLAAMALAAAGAPYPAGVLDRAWRLMARNDAHDGIGSCHTDAVARDVTHRFARVREIAACAAAEAMDALAGARAYEAEPACPARIMLFNPSGRAWSGPVEFEVDLPDTHGRDWPLHARHHGVTLWDGPRAVPVAVLHDAPAVRPRFVERVNPQMHNVRRLRLLAHAPDVPPLGWKTLRLLPADGGPAQNIMDAGGGRAASAAAAPAPLLAPEPGLLRNGRLEVRVHPDGRFDVTDLETGRRREGLNALLCEQDAGNLYAFKAARGRRATRPAAGSIATVLNTPLRAALRVETTWELFDERLTHPEPAERQLGNPAPRVRCAAAVDVALSRGSRCVEVTVEIDNRGAGFRLRAGFPCGAPEARVFAAAPFELADRTPAAHDAAARAATRAQLDALDAQIMQGVVAAEDGNAGLALAGRGLYEYAHDAAGGRLALTLLRSAGHINPGFEAYTTAEGGYLPGPRRVEYAVVPFEGGLVASGALADAETFLHPPLVRQYPDGPELVSAGWDPGDARLRVTALKKAAKRNTLVLRLCNLAGEAVPVRLRPPVPVRAAWRCRLDEKREAPLRPARGTIRLEAPPHGIVTLELAPARAR